MEFNTLGNPWGPGDGIHGQDPELIETRMGLIDRAIELYDYINNGSTEWNSIENRFINDPIGEERRIGIEFDSLKNDMNSVDMKLGRVLHEIDAGIIQREYEEIPDLANYYLPNPSCEPIPAPDLGPGIEAIRDQLGGFGDW